MLPVTEGLHVQLGRDRTQFGWRCVFIGAADEQHLIAGLSSKPRVRIGWKQGADEVAEVFDAIYVRDCTR
jgi:hypothetical protein